MNSLPNMENLVKVTSKSHLYSCAYMEHIEELIDECINQLSDDEYLLVEVILYDGSKVRPLLFGCQNPYIILVRGLDENDNKVRLILNMKNIQIKMTKVKERPEPEIDIEFDKHYA